MTPAEVRLAAELLGYAIPLVGLAAGLWTTRWVGRSLDDRRATIARLELEQEEQRKRDRELELQQERVRSEEEKRRLATFCAVSLPSLLDRVRFLDRKVQVGTRKTGERATGIRVEESPVPADDIDVRPIGGPSEVGSLLPSELAYEPEMRNRRILMGEALVRQDLAHVPVMEALYEPVWETRKQVLYVLLDVSGSMHAAQWDGEWKVPVWKSILNGLLDRAVAKQAVYLQREFHDDVLDLHRADDPASIEEMRKRIDSPVAGGGTKIAPAILAGVADLAKETYDKADIVIVTDGDDDKLDVDAIRAALAEGGVGLHAILIGVENDALRACTDLAQNVNRDLSLGEVTERPKASC